MMISLANAVQVLGFCGWKNTAKWDTTKVAKKLGDVKDVAPDDPPEDADLASILTEVMETIDAKEDFEISDAEDSPAEETAAEETAEETAVEEEAAAEEAPAKDKKEKKEKKEKAPKAPKVKKEKSETWVTAATKTLKGVEGAATVDITDELIAEVNTLRGKTNDSLAKNHLRMVQAIIGIWEA